MIPKMIHYCWFGKNPKPEVALKCMETWKKFFPDWIIIEWNESNYNINANQYLVDAYEAKHWAFVSDIARLDVLYQYGGIYLDTDVEFIKALPENYLEYSGILGFEYTHVVAPGLIMGVEKENLFVKRILDTYKGERFCVNKDGWYKTINTRITDELVKDGLVKNNVLQIVDGFHVFPSEYFCGYNTDIREPEITENTICWHHYMGSWAKPSLKMRLQDLLKKKIGVDRYKKLLALKRSIVGVHLK